MKNEKDPCVISSAFMKAHGLRVSKGNDYGNQTQKELFDYFPFGHMSFAQMIHVKAKRIVSLADKERMGIEPNHESIKDSVLDILNYASYYYEWLESEEKYD